MGFTRRFPAGWRWIAPLGAGILVLGAWAAFFAAYGAATACGADLVALEHYLRAEIVQNAATRKLKTGIDEHAVLDLLMRDARARVAGMSQWECWDDLRTSPWRP